jgi:hypothetical protein
MADPLTQLHFNALQPRGLLLSSRDLHIRYERATVYDFLSSEFVVALTLYFKNNSRGDISIHCDFQGDSTTSLYTTHPLQLRVTASEESALPVYVCQNSMTVTPITLSLTLAHQHIQTLLPILTLNFLKLWHSPAPASKAGCL